MRYLALSLTVERLCAACLFGEVEVYFKKWFFVAPKQQLKITGLKFKDIFNPGLIAEKKEALKMTQLAEAAVTAILFLIIVGDLFFLFYVFLLLIFSPRYFTLGLGGFNNSNSGEEENPAKPYPLEITPGDVLGRTNIFAPEGDPTCGYVDDDS